MTLLQFLIIFLALVHFTSSTPCTCKNRYPDVGKCDIRIAICTCVRIFPPKKEYQIEVWENNHYYGSLNLYESEGDVIKYAVQYLINVEPDHLDHCATFEEKIFFEEKRFFYL
jgi:hypothetical protein